MANVDLYDMLITEIELLYKKGGNPKQYGKWAELANTISTKYNHNFEQEQLRKGWFYVHKQYKADYDALNRTGCEGYEEYWAKK